MTHVIDSIANAAKYAAQSPCFAKAIAFLQRPDLAALPCGRYEIDGENCWACVSESPLHPFAGAKLEAHRTYIDIQAPLSGPETIGLAEASDADLALPFDVEKDFFLYEGAMRAVTLKPGQFAIFYPPRGAHAPCCRPEQSTVDAVRKVVIKIRAS